MVTPGGALRGFADDWTPIFADPNRQYDYIASIASHRRVKGGVRLVARTEGGETLQAELAFVTPEVFRLRVWLDEEPPADSPMLVEGAHRRHRPDGEVRLKVSGPPWNYRVRFLQPAVAADVRVGGDASGLAVRREDDITVVDVSGGRFELRVDAR